MTGNREFKIIAEDAAVQLADATATEILQWTAMTFGSGWIVASSMQDAVVIDLAVGAKPDVNVLFLDTGYHFAETVGTRDAMSVAYPGTRIITAAAEQSVADQESEFGVLNRTDPHRCCQLRKVVPLRRTLAGYQAWVTGMRRTDAPTRANMPVVSWDERNGLVKVNPIAGWSEEMFNNYVAEHRVLEHPLLSEGYRSIGCAPCTAIPLPGKDPRSGRWAGLAKTECGMHQ